jgi:predicted O-methyltransferase YrrM
LLGLKQASLCYVPARKKAENLALMRVMDEHDTRVPFAFISNRTTHEVFMINVAKTVRKFERLAERSWNLYSLSHEGNRITSSIAHSVRAVLKPALTPEERSWIDRIEHLRTQMNASTKQITRTDYGAGNPDSNWEQEEMRAGVEVTDTLGHISQVVSKSAFWCLLLFKLIRTMHPSSCVEMGTAVGVSAAYQAAALRLNRHGSLVTLEGATSLADIARNNFQQLDLDTVEVVVGRFQDTLTDVLTNRHPVDYVFVDGHHNEQATRAYFEQILPFLAEKALLVFDDITWSEGMRIAWNTLAKDRRVGVTVDLGPVGLCVVDSSIAGHRYFSIPLH